MSTADDTLDGALGGDKRPVIHGSMPDLVQRANAAGFATLAEYVDAMEALLGPFVPKEGRMSDADWKYVDDLSVGDRFMWADRVVTLERIEPVPRHRGSRHPSRWLHVTDDSGQTHRLNYRDAEMVATL